MPPFRRFFLAALLFDAFSLRFFISSLILMLPLPMPFAMLDTLLRRRFRSLLQMASASHSTPVMLFCRDCFFSFRYADIFRFSIDATLPLYAYATTPFFLIISRCYVAAMLPSLFRRHAFFFF